MLTRMLTAGRKKGEKRTMTCIILRPFHAVTKFAERYSTKPGRSPVEVIMRRTQASTEEQDIEFGQDDSWLRSGEFRGEHDAYIQMLKNYWYASCYVATVPRLDLNNVLPRCEFILPISTAETGKFPERDVGNHLQRLMVALATTKFDVAAEHSMFRDILKIDILPSLLIRVHETVKIWADELRSRVNEYIGYYISNRAKSEVRRGIRMRPWTASELKNFAKQLQAERNLQAGMSA